jgi:hypothetical protein
MSVVNYEEKEEPDQQHQQENPQPAISKSSVDLTAQSNHPGNPKG